LENIKQRSNAWAESPAAKAPSRPKFGMSQQLMRKLKTPTIKEYDAARAVCFVSQ